MAEQIVSDAARRLRDTYVRDSNVIDPSALTEGDAFYVINIRDAAAGPRVVVLRSGVYWGRSDDGTYFIIALDGETERSHLTAALAGFYPLGSSMTLVVRYTIHPGYAADERSEAAKQAALVHGQCPCGTKRGDGSHCPEWPDCMIP
jgi:hypothetical protein